MGLRRRLLLGVGAMLAVLALVLVGVRTVVHDYLIAQVDARLVALAGDAKQVVAVAQRAANGTVGPATALVSDLWVGVHGDKAGVVTVQAPSGDPGLVPQLDGTEPPGRAVTRATASGAAVSVRVVATPLNDRRSVVVAEPLTEVDAVTGRLSLTLLLAWLVSAVLAVVIAAWVDRLGVRPIERMTAVARAVTDRVRAGETPDDRAPVGRPGTEATELASAFNTMLDAVESSAVRQRRFVADASHELRTPLTSLQGYSALYAAGALRGEGEVADAMRRINAEAVRMTRLVEGLLQLSAVDAGAPLTLVEVDVGEMLADVAADLRAGLDGVPASVSDDRQHPANTRSIEVDAPAGMTVRADRSRLVQALLALGTNALRHGAGAVQLSARAASGDGGRQGVRIEVRDEGTGVPDDQRDAIFEPFHRAAASGVPGTGLGLALVAAIARAHDGRVAVDCTPDAGTTFWIWLPIG